MTTRALVAAGLAGALALAVPARGEHPSRAQGQTDESAPEGAGGSGGAVPPVKKDAKPAARPLRIGLDALRFSGVAAALAEVVEDRVCAALAEATPGAEVICPSDVAAAAAVAKTAMAFGECQSDECLRRVDAFRSADRRVTGALERGEKGIVLSLQIVGPDGPGPRVVEKLPEDVDALVARVPAAVKRLIAKK